MEHLARKGRRPLPDYLREELAIVFVGINPGVQSARAGHYYANPNNAFWRLLYESGLTPVRLAPAEDHRMPEFGYGLTDIVKHPSRGVEDLRPAEFRRGRGVLEEKLLRVRPRLVCFNGKAVFVGFFGATAFRKFGRQRVTIGPARVFVLPSTSPANARFSRAAKRRYFADLKAWRDELRGRGR